MNKMNSIIKRLSLKPQSFSKLFQTQKFSFACGNPNCGHKSNSTCGSPSCSTGCQGHCKPKSAIVRQEAPSFSGMAYWNGEMKKISSEDFKNKYIVLFFYPLDNTFVCPTEIVSFNDAAEEFEKINCQVISCSVDSHFSHKEWANKPRNEGGLSPMKIPMLSDLTQNISKKYGVRINNEDDPVVGVALRGTFIIDDKGILRHSSINDLNVGRNVEEVLRLVKAFQYADKNGEVCPSKWTPGKTAMKPSDPKKLNEFWKNEHAKH